MRRPHRSMIHSRRPCPQGTRDLFGILFEHINVAFLVGLVAAVSG
ncbi:hypothetical protein P3T21_007168 [Paraburkholderia sp. GAS334]